MPIILGIYLLDNQQIPTQHNSVMTVFTHIPYHPYRLRMSSNTYPTTCIICICVHKRTNEYLPHSLNSMVIRFLPPPLKVFLIKL